MRAPPSARIEELPGSSPLVQWEDQVDRSSGTPFVPHRGAQGREEYLQYDIGNAHFADLLRKQFALTGPSRFGLASEIVPVFAVDVGDSAGGGLRREWMAGTLILQGAVNYRNYFQIMNLGPYYQVIEELQLWNNAEVWVHILGTPLGGLAIGGGALSTVTFPVRPRDPEDVAITATMRAAQSQGTDVPTPPANNAGNAWLAAPALGTMTHFKYENLDIVIPPGMTFCVLGNDNAAMKAVARGYELTVSPP